MLPRILASISTSDFCSWWTCLRTGRALNSKYCSRCNLTLSSNSLWLACQKNIYIYILWKSSKQTNEMWYKNFSRNYGKYNKKLEERERGRERRRRSRHLPSQTKPPAGKPCNYNCHNKMGMHSQFHLLFFQGTCFICFKQCSVVSTKYIK